MLPALEFKIGCDASAKRQKVWKRVVKSPEITVAKIADLSDTDEVFAIGSCFANEIRAVLERVGVTVHPTIDPDLGELFLDEVKVNPRWGVWDERVHYQCFTPFTIQQEVETALGARQAEAESVFECRFKGKKVFVDPYRRSVYARSREDLLQIRERMNQRVRQGIARAKVIVMTLGLVEAFKIKGSDGFLAEYNPHISGEKLEFVNATYEQALEALTRTVDQILAAYPQKMIVVTVSPVPIARTFSDTDAITATMRGKSILRSCADTLAQRHNEVHYWPSYEYAMWSGNAFSEDDVRHICPNAVVKITSAFCRAFFSESIARRLVAMRDSQTEELVGATSSWFGLKDRLRLPFRRAA